MVENFQLMHCNWAHKLNSQFLNIVANDHQLDFIFKSTHSQKYIVEQSELNLSAQFLNNA